ncbi:deoxyuridine 5'-triphosphate nucleotidohydrolase [Setomelanomma holmii]|uniref:Deoxyuridine 5'-triphosphate nucleotidohydrolase n=1 Tax=Setomelanomma holmii TaxID=210430 RepID=A0A9P4LLK9_9PLEO|nr:deoxyuridine 5'-triphosphate nucleotidohydrolase [Setomelanomma holmii]
MIIPGRVALSCKIITQVLSAEHQTQPCGIDLTLKRIMTWTSPGTIDFDNKQRRTAQTVEIPFKRDSSEYTDVSCGSYLVEFHEIVNMPLDLMGQIFVRSSLFGSGALIHAGVVNPHGLRLIKDAKLAQMVFHQMSEPVEGYNGVYQGRTFV